MYLMFLPGISNNISTIKWKQLYSSKIHFFARDILATQS